MKNRDWNIDLIKVICTFAVVALHSQRSLVTGELFNSVLYYASRFAMPLFFMCNGYLILKKKSFGFKYFCKKVLNIIRVMTLWSFITFMLSLLVEQNSLTKALLDGIKCFIGVNIAPFWFLYSLIIIYIVLLLFFDLIKKHLNKILIFLFATMLIIDIISVISIFRGGYFVQSKINQRFRIWTWMFYFVIGYKIKEQRGTANIIKVGLVAAVLTVMSVAVQYYLCCIMLNKINSEYMYDNIIIIAWSLSVFVFLNSIIIKPNTILTFLSKNSFGVFLLHPYLIHYFHLTEIVSGWLSALVLWVILVLSCYLITFVFRKAKFGKLLFEY